MPKMATTTKEFREQIEWVMSMLTTVLLPLLKSLVSILVINLATIGVGKGFVSFSNFNKLLFRRFVASIGWSVIL
jgi:hypothetical protein